MNQEINTLELLGARYYAYRVLRSVFGVEPSPAQFDVIRDPVTAEAFSLLFEQTCHDNSWRGVLQDLLATSYEERILDEYTRFFLGPGHIIAPPWESVYVSDQPLLFQESTIDARKNYLTQGYIPEKFPHVPDDQLSIELDYMEKLALRMCESLSGGGGDALKELILSSLSFLESHLCNWLGLFRDRIKENEGTFYAVAADLLEKYVMADRMYLACLKEELQ